MKIFIVAVFCLALIAGQGIAQEQAELKTPKDKASYSVGYDIGRDIKQQEVDINTDLLLKGMKDALTGAKTAMPEQEMKETLQKVQQEMLAKQRERMQKLAEKNKKEGDAFLQENKKKEGVKTTASGLQYRVLAYGKGAKATVNDMVLINYKGTLINGAEFDSSYKRGQPATFPVKGIIPGVSEALQMMNVGSKYQFVIPPEIGYGMNPAGPIGPNSVLIFEIELLEIKKAQASPSKAPAKTPSKAPAKKQ